MRTRATNTAPDVQAWQTTEPWVRRGMKLVTWMCGGLLLYTTVVSISGAVIAPGRVTVEGNYQQVQHLDGGIVKEILVKNGDRVRQGDVLLRLDATLAEANLAVARQRVRDLALQTARLESERDRRATIALPASLDAADPETQRLYAAQKSLFEARRTTRYGEQSVLQERRSQLGGDIRGQQSQLDATLKQIAINERELGTLRPLYEKGYVNQQRMAPLERESARLEGEAGRLKSEISKSQGAIMEIELRIAQSEKSFTSEVIDELRRIEASLAEQLETEKAQADRLARIVVRAPRSGRVHAMQSHTIGGVVTPASPIMQVIPDDDRLIVTAEVRPQDVDKVRAGQNATLRFPAFNSHTTPTIEGRVVRVSPAEINVQGGHSYYTAEVEIGSDQLARLPARQALVPGMPAEVYMATQSRTILSYLMKPLLDSLSHTFREG